jgi:hypothetical protein
MPLLMLLPVEAASAVCKPFTKSGAFHTPVAPVKTLDQKQRPTMPERCCDIIVWPIIAGGMLVWGGFRWD